MLDDDEFINTASVAVILDCDVAMFDDMSTLVTAPLVSLVYPELVVFTLMYKSQA